MVPDVVRHFIERIGTWAYGLSIAQWIRGSEWGVPILSVTHVFGLILLLGSVFMIALRCFGLALRRDPVSAVIRALSPATLGGLFLMTASGSLIFASGAGRYVDSYPFQLKMMAYSTAVVTQGTVYVMALRDDDENRLLSPRWMTMGGLAFLLWLSVATLGRFIAFFE
jgi:hypothetical protein